MTFQTHLGTENDVYMDILRREVKKMIPRTTTKDEKEDLVKYVANQMSSVANADDLETATGHVEGAAIAVFDNYITDSPGYAGKLMMVVWPGSPDFYEVFIWDRGTM